MVKSCRTCGESKSLELFYRAAENRDGRSRECKSCAGARARQWHADNREKSRVASRRYKQNNPEKVAAYVRSDANKRAQRKSFLKRNYGMTVSEYAALLDAQDGVCIVCGSADDGRVLCVDHCHDSGAVRALLCRNCNVALGALQEDPARITALAAYAANWKGVMPQ